ncbi:Tripartite-type tricarboxylate transporter, receptor component TctC [Natronoarchaeum philippinense]|uniref:Tripartite-type tricarboxylate transporter, receptor component TctC n=1 Tax=Natronoarchaeum philippinense TaxID=558529 RepID=A0A285NS79_NATPI|nr:tripartite tricarboxylate transporter substrate binding protein [Natronoarchaeum philippinense]SNZ12038.1 Tripartite-type tricarboxylate transporter, receptor component TctC [Natronoarchaeum philippinense]
MTDRKRFDRRTVLQAAGGGALVGLAGCTDQLTPDDGGGGGGDPESFPSQDIEMICPWAEGGGTDRTARALADMVQDELDASAFVTNQTGGSGSVGFNAISNAEPDGHTVGVLTVEICTIDHLGVADISPDDVAGVMQYNFDPASLTVHQDAPYGTLEEFVTYAENNPGEIRVSNSGQGAIWHLSAAGFAREAGIELDHIGYDGAAPATEAVLSGEVEATTSSAAEVAPQVQDGPLEMLAFFGEERHPLFPDVPTLQESGYDFSMGAWRAIGVPTGVDEAIVGQLHDSYRSVYESNEFQQFMQDNGFGMVYRDTQEFEQFMDSEYERFGQLISELGLGG